MVYKTKNSVRHKHICKVLYIHRNSREHKCEIWVSLLCCRCEGDLGLRVGCKWSMTGNEMEDVEKSQHD